MQSADPESYGNRFADVFDELYGESAPDAQIATLRELAGPGPVLELGVGTGRVAIPLTAAGLKVQGLDSSKTMLAALAAKPGGESIETFRAALPEIPLDDQYRLITCVDNTLILLPTQDEQVQFFANAAERLTADGVLVLETLAVGHLTDPTGTGLVVDQLGAEVVSLWAHQIDSTTQRFTTRQIIVKNDFVRVIPFSGRLVSPAELDLMARLAGLRLRARWGGWDRDSFTPASFLPVSVYEKIPVGASR